MMISKAELQESCGNSQSFHMVLKLGNEVMSHGNCPKDVTRDFVIMDSASRNPVAQILS
jgi:hypothetical protein